MSLHRAHPRPHTFLPHIAKKFGLLAAIVDHAITDIIFSRTEDCSGEYEIEEVCAYCYYLSKEQVEDAVRVLISAGEFSDSEVAE